MKTLDSPSVLVVAPDADLRHSLAFILSAEGFSVKTDTVWPPQGNLAHTDLVVIDHGAFADKYPGDETLSGLTGKIVILARRERILPLVPGAVVVHKPLLERELIDTLNTLL
ncbi:hypothetical protein [Asticcacaulis sp.]|uniref:hypothetical protein n=1 Tax=Asticcacaulis sp. TaxID=1872648 RepID=UPI002B8D96AB|nr:hypothetical protein [Asticcacaulis sp.]HTM82069.1 hypothetical protein [Asticcacaulis sp.]